MRGIGDGSRVWVEAEASGLLPSMNGATGLVRPVSMASSEDEWRRRWPGIGRPGSGLPAYAWKGKAKEDGGGGRSRAWGVLSTGSMKNLESELDREGVERRVRGYAMVHRRCIHHPTLLYRRDPWNSPDQISDSS